MIAGTLRRVLAGLAGRADYALTASRLWLLDRVLAPPAETPEDRAIREEGERLRKAFPGIDFDAPRLRIIPPHKPH